MIIISKKKCEKHIKMLFLFVLLYYHFKRTTIKLLIYYNTYISENILISGMLKFLYRKKLCNFKKRLFIFYYFSFFWFLCEEQSISLGYFKTFTHNMSLGQIERVVLYIEKFCRPTKF